MRFNFSCCHSRTYLHVFVSMAQLCPWSDNLNSRPQRYVLPDNVENNETCFLISYNNLHHAGWHRITKKKTVVAQSTSAGRRVRTPVLVAETHRLRTSAVKRAWTYWDGGGQRKFTANSGMRIVWQNCNMYAAITACSEIQFTCMPAENCGLYTEFASAGYHFTYIPLCSVYLLQQWDCSEFCYKGTFVNKIWKVYSISVYTQMDSCWLKNYETLAFALALALDVYIPHWTTVHSNRASDTFRIWNYYCSAHVSRGVYSWHRIYPNTTRPRI